jgi:tetratricopeptide (TPR) repeat protein
MRVAYVVVFLLATQAPRHALSLSDAAEVESLRGKAVALRDLARYAESEALLRRALAIAAESAPADTTHLCGLWNELGVLYKYMGRFDEAGRAYTNALPLAHGAVLATVYHNLGGLEHARGRYAAGEPFARRAVAIRERLLGPDHPDVAADLAALAPILDAQGKRNEAAALMLRSLAILERTYGPNHYEVAVSLNNLAALRAAEGQTAEARRLYERSLAIKERQLGPRHPDVATTLNNLAVLHKKLGDARTAALLYARALSIFEASLGSEHPKTAACRANYGRLLAISLDGSTP